MRPPLLPRVLACVAVALLLSSARAEKPFAFADTPGKLPKTIAPRAYTLFLHADPEARTTRGTATIEFDVLAPTREIVLNALALQIDSAALRIAGTAAASQSLSPKIDEAQQTLTFTAPAELPRGRHALTIAYRGKIGTAAEGFFVDKYPTGSGDKLLLGTQMEPTDARRVFPCWDEPVFRATFDITLEVPAKLTAVGNMPSVSETSATSDGKAWKQVRFARTPAMPTYLVALYAAEFETVEAEQDGVQLRVLTTEGKRESARYALESAKRILKFYNEYFGVRYPLPKLDQIAVPAAFATFGAMENWGAITYIDTALLYDPKTSSQARREAVFTTVAHEMAHQWFGNLVTMAWWDNLWLNEGFASWMGTKCSDALNPEWQLWARANADKEIAMELDARKTTHPIQRPIASESQASDAFDVISYRKGQSFLRMLEAYLGPETFRSGIRRYIADHQYSNTTTADLWAALGAASGKPVVAIAAGWTEQPGFPVVLVSAGENAGELRLEQNRFTLNDPQPAPLGWKIPVTVGDPMRNERPSVALLEDRRATLPRPANAALVKANVGDTGYYRVFYDEPLREALASQIRTLPATDQLNLLGDAWAFVENGALNARAWLDLVAQLGDVQSPPVWSLIIARLNKIDLLERDTRGRRAFQAWAAQFLGPQLARLGWAPRAEESPLETSLRAALVRELGDFGDQAVIAECNRRFEAFLKEPSTLTGDLRDSVLHVVGRYATRDTYEKLHALARAAKTTEEKRRAYSAMQSALDPALAHATLALTLGDELSVNEATSNVERVAREGEQDAIAWDFAREHANALLARTTFFGRNVYLPRIAGASTDAKRADELEAATRQHLPPDALAEAQKTSDLIRHLSAVKQRELPIIDGWVRERIKTPEL